MSTDKTKYVLELTEREAQLVFSSLEHVYLSADLDTNEEIDSWEILNALENCAGLRPESYL